MNNYTSLKFSNFSFFFLILYFFSTYSFAQNPNKITITLGTFHYPPLMIANKQDEMGLKQGLGVEFVKRAFKNHPKFQLRVEFYPVKRSMAKLARKEIDIFLGSRLDLPEISNKITAIKIFPLKSVLFCMDKNCEYVNKQDSFSNLGTIASIPRSPVNRPLREDGNKVMELENLDKSIKFWLLGRARYVAAINFAACYALQKMDLLENDKIKQAKKSILEIPYDAVILKSNKYAKEILTLLTEELKHKDKMLDSNAVIQNCFVPKE